MKKDKNILGPVIRRLREKRGWNQTELGKKVGFAQTTISGHEKQNRSISDYEIEIYASVFNLSAQQLFEMALNETDDLSSLTSKDDQKKEDKNIKTIAAHLEGKDITDDKMKDVLNYIDFIFRDQFDK